MFLSIHLVCQEPTFQPENESKNSGLLMYNICFSFELCFVANNIQPMYGYCIDALLWKIGDCRLIWNIRERLLKISSKNKGENVTIKQYIKLCYCKTLSVNGKHIIQTFDVLSTDKNLQLHPITAY